MPDVFTTNSFFVLQQCPSVLPIENLTITYLSWPLLVLERGSRLRPSISLTSTSIPQSLQMLTTVFSRLTSGKVCGIPVSSTLFLQLYLPPVNLENWLDRLFNTSLIITLPFRSDIFCTKSEFLTNSNKFKILILLLSISISSVDVSMWENDKINFCKWPCRLAYLPYKCLGTSQKSKITKS